MKNITTKARLGFGALGSALASASILGTTAVQSYAYKFKFFSKVQKQVSNLTTDIITVSSTVAGLMLVVAFATILLSKDPKKVSSGWSWVKGIAIAYVCILSVVAITKFIGDFAVK